MNELKGRLVVVSGANRGLGLAIAEACAAAGADLLLGARDPKSAPKVSGSGRVEWRALDIANAASIAAFAGGLKSVDALVNNAGIYGPSGHLADTDAAAWEEALQVNLFGTVRMCRVFLPLLKASPRGKIINLSGGGATQPQPGLSAYAAGKAALVRLTETLAQEEPGLDVNALAPGALNTRMLDQVLEAGPEKVGEAFYKKSLKQKAEGGTPLSVGAGCVAWLASRASDGVSGRLISAVWDPWRELPARRDELAAGDIYTLRRIVPADRGKNWGEPR
jgi:NAD(P)-dependent dehydrogenase (short-subunit alcohol dehydrogenase family)